MAALRRKLAEGAGAAGAAGAGRVTPDHHSARSWLSRPYVPTPSFVTGRTLTDTQVIVIGGGVMGAASAWALARRGVQVCLLEQFAPGHALGASHGRARIFRLAYAEQLYVRFGQAAHPLWRQLENEAGRALLTLTGAVDHGDPSVLAALSAALREAGEATDLLPGMAAEEHWPGLRFDGPVLHHPTAGRIDADAAVAAFLSAAQARGADVRSGVTVDRLESHSGSGVSVHTTDGRMSAASVVLAAGGWTSRLLDGLLDGFTDGLRSSVPPPVLRLTQEQPALFAPLDPAQPWPSFIHHPRPDAPGIPPVGAYGLGGTEGVKIGFHGVGPVVDPDHRARDAGAADPATLAALQAYAREWLPGVDPATAIAQTCSYNSTVDSDFVVDRIGAITIAAGFSGHGFKFAPAIGALVADLVEGRRTTPDRWSITRSRSSTSRR
jgi:sarcosine oxidase